MPKPKSQKKESESINLKEDDLSLSDAKNEIKKEGLANYFYLFIENIKRESVVKSADYLLKSLDQFIKIIK